MWQNAKADYGVRARPGAASCPHEDQAQQMVSDLQAQTCMVLSCAQGIALAILAQLHICCSWTSLSVG